MTKITIHYEGCVVSQKDAKEKGLKFFFNGKPCHRRHIAQRYISGSCRACKAEDRVNGREKNVLYLREWRKSNPDYVRPNPEKRRETRRKYYESNRATLKARVTAWRKRNPQRVAAIGRRSREKNKAMLRQRAREKYLRNRDKIAKRDKIYRDKNLEKRRAGTTRWRRENPDKCKIIHRNKKARRKGAPGSHTKSDIDFLLRVQKGKCVNCRCCLVKYGQHVDHIIALVNGGSNDKKNLQLLCPKCNMEKKAKCPIKWAQENGRLL